MTLTIADTRGLRADDGVVSFSAGPRGDQPRRRVFTAEYNPPKSDGSGNIRDGLRAALKLLKEAGWTFRGEKLVSDETATRSAAASRV